MTATPTIAEAIPLEVLNRQLNTPTPVPMTPMATLSATPAHGLQLESHEFFPMGWRCETLYERGWIDLACGHSINIHVQYKGHHHDPQKGECTPLVPSSLHVDIDAPQVLVRVFGSLARDLLGLKENYPGEYINMTPFRSDIPDAPPTAQDTTTPPLSEAPVATPYQGPDSPPARTVDITVLFKLCNVIAEFPGDVSKSCPGNFPLPSLCTDMLRVDVDYVASDTIVCVRVDPISVHVPSIENSSIVEEGGSDSHMLGHVIIQSINFNCHGFTEYMCAERVEYAWMMQLLIGRITGAVSPRQLMVAGDWLLTTVTHVFGIGDSLAVAPDGESICPRVEPIAEEVKYRLFQLDVCEADVHVCEARTITRLQFSGLDLDFCSLHESGETLGVSWQLHALTVTSLLPDPRNPAVLLEAGLLDIGHVTGGVALSEPGECVTERQQQFLHKADERTRRLWFLWDNREGCGCCGGCKFLNGSLARRRQCPPSQSAVYSPPFQPLEVVPRQLGIAGLASELQSTSLQECPCMWAIHRNLLDHYQMRYGTHARPLPTPESPPSSRCSDSEIFHSARSSLASSMWLDEEVASVKLKDVRHGGHKRSASQLHRDLRAAMEEVDGDQVEEQYSDLVASSYLHSATFYIAASTSSPTSNSPTHGAEGPETTPLYHTAQATPQGHTSNSFQLYLPCLQSHCSGSLPKISHKPFTSTLERRRHAHSVGQQQPCQSDHAPKFSVSLNIGNENVLRLSPLVLDAMET